jgi:hypothetical protein
MRTSATAIAVSILLSGCAVASADDDLQSHMINVTFPSGSTVTRDAENTDEVWHSPWGPEAQTDQLTGQLPGHHMLNGIPWCAYDYSAKLDLSTWTWVDDTQCSLWPSARLFAGRRAWTRQRGEDLVHEVRRGMLTTRSTSWPAREMDFAADAERLETIAR